MWLHPLASNGQIGDRTKHLMGLGTGTRTKRIESATAERNPGSFAVCAGSREDRAQVGEDDPPMLDVFMM